MAFQTHNVTLDSGLELKAAGLVASDASGASLSGGVAYVDLTGAANAYARFAVVIDWTACEVATGDEVYDIQVFGCAATNFTTDYILCSRKFGDASVTFQGNDTPPSGRAILYGDNVAHTSATDGNSVEALRYVRLSVDVGGTIGTGMNFTATIVPIP
jgi:hypothetical protein